MPVNKNTIHIKGKVTGILDQKSKVSVLKILCKPDWVVINLEDSHNLRLNDQIIVKGSFYAEELHKVDLELYENRIESSI